MPVLGSVVATFLLVMFVGEVDVSSKLNLEAVVLSPFFGANPPRSIVLDLSKCTYIDGAALAVSFSALAHVDWLGVVGAGGNIRRLLATVGLAEHDRVRFFDSRQAAFAFFADEAVERPPEPSRPER